MKHTYYTILFCCLALFFGCESDEYNPVKTPERLRVKLSGSLPKRSIQTRAIEYDYVDPGGMIDPLEAGLPPYQLKIGIVTIEFGNTENPDPPSVAEWNNETTYLDYGFFGGSVPDDRPSNYEETGSGDDPESRIDLGWTGNIEYTNRMGDAIQNVYYDEMGVYYYFVCVYPYHSIYDIENVEEDENGSMIWDDELGAAVVFEVDGSQDIMASTMGFGNIDKNFNETLYFSHKLTSLRCHFFAESELAKTMYGTIDSVKLVDQPLRIGLNIGKQAEADKHEDELFDADSELKTDYPAVRSSEVSLPLTATSADFGYMLAMPAQSYRFKIFTSGRGKQNPLYAEYTFTDDDHPQAGKMYNLTFKMLETAEILLEAAEAKGWNFDQTFD